jgi:hypothetical protein
MRLMLNSTLEIFCLEKSLNAILEGDGPWNYYNNRFLVENNDTRIAFSIPEKICFEDEKDASLFTGRFLANNLLSLFSHDRKISRNRIDIISNKTNSVFNSPYCTSPFVDKPIAEDGFMWMLKLNDQNQLVLKRISVLSYDIKVVNKFNASWLSLNKKVVLNYCLSDYSLSCIASVVLNRALKKCSCRKRFKLISRDDAALIKKCSRFLDKHQRLHYFSSFAEIEAQCNHTLIVASHDGSIIYSLSPYPESCVDAYWVIQGPNGKFYPMHQNKLSELQSSKQQV